MRLPHLTFILCLCLGAREPEAYMPLHPVVQPAPFKPTYIVLLAAVLARVFMVLSPVLTQAADQANRHDIMGQAFSIELPTGWFSDESDIGGFAGAFAPEGDKHASVFVKITAVGATHLADRVQAFREGIRPPDYVFSDSDLLLGGVPAHAFVMGESGGRPDGEFVITIKDEKEYDILLHSSGERFVSYQSVFHTMLRSIVWRPAPDRTYHSSDGAISLTVPPGFMVVEGGEDGLRFVLVGPKQTDFAPSIAIWLIPLEGRSFQTYVDHERNSKSSGVSAIEVEDRPYLSFRNFMGPASSDQPRIVGGLDALELFFPAMSVPAPEPPEHDLDISGPRQLRITVAEVLVHDSASVWIFRFNTQKKSSDYLALFNQVLESVRWGSKR